MNKSALRLLNRHILIAFLFILIFAGKCNRGLRMIQDEQNRKQAVAKRTRDLIRTIQGIKYTEIRRQFDNGLSFSPVGFQLVPEWRISFPSVDSVNIYSPRKHKFLNAPVVFDHDSIFNVAWAWLKLKHLSKDSLQFMVLHVTDNVIHDEKVHVYMTFYANDYLTNKLHADTATYWKPSHRDTLYIKTKALQANRIPDSSFAATEPAVLVSKSKLITVKKDTAADYEVDAKSYDQYLLPTYNITIHKAYEDFNYLFSAFVDEKGNLIFRKSNQFMMPEFKKTMVETMKAITDGYLKAYLKVTPGKTLGIPHYSIILLNVSGHKN